MRAIRGPASRLPLCLGAALVLAAAGLVALRPAAAEPVARVHGPAVAATASLTTNWSGYVVTNPEAEFRNVTATWRQPAARCARSGDPSSAAVWVGIGGFTPGTHALQQVGTSAECGAGGKASYHAWWELVPAPAVQVPLRVAPGDVLTASVVVDGSSVLFQIKNRTRRRAWTKRVPAERPDLSSAEWIAEAPAECGALGGCRQLGLANFGSVTFRRVAALATLPSLGDQGGTITSPLWRATRLHLVPGAGDPLGRSARAPGAVAAKPSPDGRSFTVAWVADPSAR